MDSLPPGTNLNSFGESIIQKLDWQPSLRHVEEILEQSCHIWDICGKNISLSSKLK